MISIPDLELKHRPNTPRTHDAKGNRVTELVQCQADLQAWPCEIRQLLDLLELAEKRMDD